MKERRVGSVATKVVSILLAVVILLGLCPVVLYSHAEATTGEQGFLELKVYPYIGGVKSEKARTNYGK